METKQKVKIIDLGRDNFNGEFTFEGNQDEINKQIIEEIGKHLLSSDIEVIEGTIFAGFRTVGKIEVSE